MSRGVAVSRRSHLHALPLLFGIIATQKFNVAGEVYLGELLGIIYLLTNSRNLKLVDPLRTLFVLTVIWVVSQVVADFANESVFGDAIKGAGAPILLFTTLVALTCYFRVDSTRMPSFLIGAQIGLIFQFIFYPSAYFSANPWKWGVGLMVGELFAIWFSFFARKPSKLLLLTFLVSFVATSLLNSSRSAALFPLLGVAVFLLIRRETFRARILSFRSRYGLGSVALVGLAVGAALNVLATSAFSSSTLLSFVSDEAASKLEKQSGGEYGVLLGGRSEILASADAFLDRPLLGHGSWAKDADGKYLYAQAERSVALGYSDNAIISERDTLIPAHSYLMGALVWAGLGGGLLWVYVLRWILRAYTSGFALNFYVCNGGVALSWNILFSPFGASARWSTAVFMAAMIFIVHTLRTESRASQRVASAE